MAESCLAHVVKNQVEAAYRRSDLLAQRRAVMEDWGKYLGAGCLASTAKPPVEERKTP